MRKTFRIFLYIALAYLLLATFALPPLLNWQLKKIYQQETGRELQLGGSWFNPITLEVGLEELAVHDPDGELLLGFDELAVDFSLLGTVFLDGYRLDALSLQGLQGHLRLLKEGDYSFADILRHREGLPTAPAEESNEPPPAFYIGEIDITAHRLAHSDLSRSEPFSHQLRDLQLSSKGFSIGGEGNASYQLSLNSRGGGQLSIAGELSLLSQQASGTLTIEQLSLLPLWELLSPQLAFRLQSGDLSAGLGYQLSWKSGLQFKLADSRIELAEMAIEPLTADPELPNKLSWQRLTIAGVAVDSETRQARVGDIQWQNLQLESGHRQEGDTLRLPLVEMFAAPAKEQAIEQTPQTTPDSAPWQVQLDRFSMDSGELSWRADALGNSPVQLRSLDMIISEVSWPEQGAMTVDVSGAINGQGRVSVSGELAPQSLQGQLQVGIQLPLAAINSLLGASVNGEFDSGQFNADMTLGFANQGLATITGQSAVDNLSLVDASGADVVAWQQLSIDGLQVNLPQQRIAIEKISLAKPDARMAIDQQGSSNLQRLLGQEGTVAEESVEPAETTAPWELAIKEVAIDSGQVAFSDASLAEPFAARLEQLSGTVTSFHSSGDTPAKVNLKGLVDDYAPIALTGTLGPTIPSLNLDLAFELDTLEVPSLSPYSGTYVGRAIDQGQLQLELAYQVKDNRLKGKNKVRIEQLSLGDKVDSPDAVSLPLGAAVALLKDVNGVINMSVPISGDLADPSFTVSSVVWSAFQNLIIKTVASPFKLLGSLVGAEDDLQRVPFAPGAVTLSERSQQKVAMLAQALAERPNLKLTLQGQYDQERDGAHLQQQQLDSRLQEAGLGEQSLADRDERWAAVVSRLYRQTFPDRPVAERPASALYDELLGHQAIDPAALLSLAESRAQTVMAQLSELGVVAERIRLKEATEKSADGSQVVLDI
ncbi:DUF748 domain-containing protein [Porticoccus sp. W117]|uniref:DUF748 domain-containing protein n=1 Tax=Porticoccus sp. W117 TaxID=3054777 RepID=UPI002597BB3A|nr:DUF748 domain-containing protein [Porticoccus sp. W117]MDM3869996.1 DUF748 domain-containing protein [Porticoccus sp. W117]